ncbi:hypothetical protein OPKNFCMD_0727 [Methylobacterium crusticola]|uniref:Uncharacterized protein n=1 Tax=Methylobacterium crusticola TaxID=1697972 RepID=A0ABQ4QRU5_9HYPH|nr:hypothetical protein [Methylobacterium crusticola]GJD48013.1 hypothetical protein OPKNFCMD_0727 [Methylobacterium crusticola]
MRVGDRAWQGGRLVEVGVCGLARYARMSTGETIWWGSEEDVPDRVALAASATETERAGNGGALAREPAA